MYFDMANDGYQQHTAWAAAGDGVLVYDPGGGAVTQANQVEFTLWDPAAKTDMQALEDVFDTNHDGVLNASDADWSDFYVMVTNANGTTTLETMAQAGVTSINLQANSYKQVFTDGSSIDGETTFTRANGTVGTAGTASLTCGTACRRDHGGHGPGLTWERRLPPSRRPSSCAVPGACSNGSPPLAGAPAMRALCSRPNRTPRNVSRASVFAVKSGRGFLCAGAGRAISTAWERVALS